MSEERKYPIGGYAPGFYACTCANCKKKFQGDKRAVQCEPCAVAADEAWKNMSPDEQVAVTRAAVKLMEGIFKDAFKPMEETK